MILALIDSQTGISLGVILTALSFLLIPAIKIAANVGAIAESIKHMRHTLDNLIERHDDHEYRITKCEKDIEHLKDK